MKSRFCGLWPFFPNEPFRWFVALLFTSFCLNHKRCLLKTTILYFNGNLRLKRLLYPMVVVVAELADWSLLTTEVCGSNVVIFSDDCCKDENK